jgi:transposase
LPAQPKGRNYRKNHGDTENGKRGAIVALHSVGIPNKDIQDRTGVPKRTIAGILQHVNQNTISNSENSDPLASKNLNRKKRTGRPEKFSEIQKEQLVQLCTANASQRRKS